MSLCCDLADRESAGCGNDLHHNREEGHRLINQARFLQTLSLIRIDAVIQQYCLRSVYDPRSVIAPSRVAARPFTSLCRLRCRSSV